MTGPTSWSPQVRLTPRERDVLRLMGEDLSNADIAERLVVSPQTVKWYVKEIYSKLGVHSRDEALALLDVYAEDMATPAPANPYDLPSTVTSLVGRQSEIEAICAWLRDPAIRLVTLVGTGGIGKTRLSLEVARRLTGDFPDGVVFVPLAPVSDPVLVADALLEALGMEPGSHPRGERLYAFLRNKRLLMVLDNCEHLLPAAPLTGVLLAEAPAIKLLATSREPLRVYGEHEFPVQPLDPFSEAVALFEARSRLVQPEFVVTNGNSATVTAICQRLDGLPLAIELAAARMKLLTPQALLGRLDNQLDVLTGGARNLPPRQQTLRGAIAWSYDLLTPDEQRLFARFAVFEGGASLEAFADVCAYGLLTDSYDALESLVSKSMLRHRTDASGEPRFYMYESLREFAAEQLAASGDEVATRQTHARHYLALGCAWAGHTLMQDEFEAFAAFVAEYSNIRAAWMFAAGQPDDEQMLAAAYAFKHLFGTWSWIREGSTLYETALAPRRHGGTLIEANLLAGWSYMSIVRKGAADDADLEAAQEAAAICERYRQPVYLTGAIFSLMTAAIHRRDLDEAERSAVALGRLGEELGLQPYVDISRYNLAGLRLRRGDIPGALALYTAHLADIRPRNVLSLMIRIIGTLITLTVNIGELKRARDLANELAGIAEATGQPLSRLYAYAALANFAILDGDLEEACRLGQQHRAAAEQLGRDTAIAAGDALLGGISARQGERALAVQHLASALARADRFPPSVTHDLVGTAAPSVALCIDQPELAVAFAAFALRLKPPGWHGILLAPVLAELEAVLGPDGYAAARARGESMDASAALALARQLASLPA